MPLITPYSPSDIGHATSGVHVAWQLSSARAGATEQVAAHTTANASSATWVTSFIECRHPEGKLWRSMFIPITASGAAGFSLTWWGKDDLVKGQTQCKMVSENDWYAVVKSKAVAKGYDVVNYIGRQVPLQVGHNFVKEIVDSSSIPQLPMLALTQDQSANLFAVGQGDKIGSTLGKALSNILPTHTFFANLNGKGHSLAALLSEAYGDATTTSEKDVIQGLMRELSGDLTAIQPIKRAPEPQVDREEVYGSGWGAFG